MAAQPDFKTGTRQRATQAEWRSLHDQLRGTYGCCQACGQTGGNLNAHHLVPRSLGGDDVLGNLALLCGSGTTGCHGAFHHGDQATVWALRANLTSHQVAYIVRKKGDAFLDRYYPLGGGGSSAVSAERAAADTAAPSPLAGDSASPLDSHQDGEDEPCSACKGTGRRRKREKREPARQRRTVSITVPADSRENGAEILDGLFDLCEEALRAELGYDGEKARYHVLCAVLTDWLQDKTRRVAA